LQRHGVDRAALDRGVVGEDEALHAADDADAGDLRSAGRLAVVHPLGGQRREFEEGCAGVEQPLDALAGQQLAGGAEPGRAPLAAAGAGLGLALG